MSLLLPGASSAGIKRKRADTLRLRHLHARTRQARARSGRRRRHRGLRPRDDRLRTPRRQGRHAHGPRQRHRPLQGHHANGLTSLRVSDFIRNHAHLIRLFIHSVACAGREVKGKISENKLFQEPSTTLFALRLLNPCTNAKIKPRKSFDLRGFLAS